jgi:DNA repair exonuclease SbcCD ATPase subunit
MPNKLEKILSESAGLSQEQQKLIVEAWDAKLNEARSQIRNELREEYAAKYEHDKTHLAETMETFLNDRINAELGEYADEQQRLAEARVEYKQKIVEHTDVLNEFVTKGLAKEVKDLRADKIAMAEKFKKLENFLLKQLAEELREFHDEKKALVEQKVKMVREGKKHLVETKQQFIKRAAKLVESNIDKVLTQEISQFKEEIKESRENEFGRRVFDAFVGEFMSSQLNEGTEVRKLQKILADVKTELETVKESTESMKSEKEALETKLTESRNTIKRNTTIFNLLSPLDKSKRKVMAELLESVQTENLEKAFNKYLPTVLNDNATQTQNRRTTVTESAKLSAKNGGRANLAHPESSKNESDIELDEIINLAGLKK